MASSSGETRPTLTVFFDGTFVRRDPAYTHGSFFDGTFVRRDPACRGTADIGAHEVDPP